jgi:prepilin-type N-terminal cleavage/methylation domain-containing protein
MRSSGFSLIELIVVTTILGIIMGVSFVNLQSAQRRALVRQGAVEVSTLLLQARSEAQRYNANATVSLNADNISYTLSQNRNNTTFTQTFRFPTSVTVILPTGQIARNIVYTAPHGEVASAFAFCLRLGTQTVTCDTNASSNPRASVSVVGLTGKVVIAN